MDSVAEQFEVAGTIIGSMVLIILVVYFVFRHVDFTPLLDQLVMWLGYAIIVVIAIGLWTLVTSSIAAAVVTGAAIVAFAIMWRNNA